MIPWLLAPRNGATAPAVGQDVSLAIIWDSLPTFVGENWVAWPFFHKSSVLERAAVILQISQLEDDLPSFADWDMLRKRV